MTEYTYGPWIFTEGNECPVEPKTMIRVLLREETMIEAEKLGPFLSAGLNWNHSVNHPSRILAYQIATPVPEPVRGERVFYGTNDAHFSLYADAAFGVLDTRVTLPTLDGKLVSGMCKVESIEAAE